MGSTVGQTTLLGLALPIILIHGYAEDSSVWDEWLGWMDENGLNNAYPVTFSNDDRCGSVEEHSHELSSIVDSILNDTGSDRVNMIAHSKGGLDARWYISENPNKVSSLIMIATPNTGTPAAYMDLTTCSFEGGAGLEDLQPDSEATQAADQPDTDYYTIAGNYSNPCAIVIHRYICYLVENDGLVTVDSATSHYKILGTFGYHHSTILEHRDVYETVLPILMRFEQ